MQFRPTADIDVSYQHWNAVFMPRTRLGREVCEKCLRTSGQYVGRHYIVPINSATTAHNRLVQEGARIGAVGYLGWGAIHHA